ncbi:MAG: ATP-dependent protease, partial [Candidatus Nealsonbacteria bacterium]|nr:ATP-dependent protease [Candidatus Nealsonbacteria bacterium]
GYFHAKYGKDKPISFSASICFEQSYNGIEGDSASAAELFCLISSLSGLPIKQCFAVTGSVNQKGEIQPIGGVNQKIEGFFDVCKERGLTGEQGVIIPHQNIKNLMLREDVVEACAKGEFRIYAMKTVDKGLELLLCAQSAEGIHNNVSSRLSEMTRALKDDGQRDSNKVSFFKKLMRIFRG